MVTVQPVNGWGDESGMVLLIFNHVRKTFGNDGKMLPCWQPMLPYLIWGTDQGTIL